MCGTVSSERRWVIDRQDALKGKKKRYEGKRLTFFALSPALCPEIVTYKLVLPLKHACLTRQETQGRWQAWVKKN